MKSLWKAALAISLAFGGVAAFAAIPQGNGASTALPKLVRASCNDPNTCVALSNSGNGAALEARAVNDAAIEGRSAHAQTGLPNPSHIAGTLFGQDVSTTPAGIENTSAGVAGLADSGLGVLGISRTNNGTVGLTFNDGSKTRLGKLGVFGYDRALDTSGANAGVAGQSAYGIGVSGISFNATGVIGATLASSAKATTNYSGFGVQGFDFSSDGGRGNVGVSAISGGTALLAIGGAPLQPAGKPQRAAILSFCAGAPAFVAKDANGATLMTLDCKGNLTIAGHITQTGSPATTPTRATVEETGSSALTNGARFVQLSGAFVGATDRRAAYAVLLTPGGESRGLYVTKAATGFLVRESDRGRSNVAFDYRVVGTPLQGAKVDAADERANSHLEIQELRSLVQRLRSWHGHALQP